MKKRLISLLICGAMLLSFAACTPKNTDPAPTEPAPVETTLPTETESVLDAGELYLAAVRELESRDNLTLRLADKTTRRIGGVEMTSSCSQDIKMAGYGTEDFRAVIGDSTMVGTIRVVSALAYRDGVAYVNAGDGLYYSEVSAQEFLDFQYPLQLIDPSLYGTAEAGEDGILRFTDAAAPESWAGSETAKDLTAQAEVTLEDGKLTSVQYTASFTQGAVPYTVNVTWEVAEAKDPERWEKQIPDTTADRVLTEYLAAPVLYELAVGHMRAATVRSIDFSSLFYSEAIGAEVHNDYSNKLYDWDGQLRQNSTVDTVAYAYDGTMNVHMEEKYADGVLQTTFILGEEEPQEDSQEYPSAMIRTVADTTLCQFLLTTEWMDTLTLTQVDDFLMFEYTVGMRGADAMQEVVVSSLTSGNATALSDLADSFAWETAKGYLCLDPDSMLPTSWGWEFLGSHSIQGGDYVLGGRVDMGLSYHDTDIYYDIWEELPEEQHPDTPASPLLYKVTDEEGHVLWLMGTIHVGDNRTGFLPDAVYDAFDGADALAVEFDDQEFVEQIENDPELSMLVAESYYYIDGTSLPDHLDEEHYNAAVLALKLTGNYSYMSDQMKPEFIANLVDLFYVGTGYSLSSHQGVDNRLMERARAQEKKILSVESGQSQLTMFRDCGDDMQAFLLEMSLSSSRTASLEGTGKLYEMWCRGSEEELSAYLNDREAEEEDEELTDEEQALYDEYVRLMITDRNQGMLEVAKGYLASGETVFYAVGMAHLLEENGLVFALRDAGYKVEQVSGS